MLFFGTEEVRAMRMRASSSHAPHAARLRAAAREMLAAPGDFVPPREPSLFAAQWNEAFGNNLGALSFYCFLYPNHTRALQLAMQYMDAMAVQPSWLVRGDPSDEVPMAHSLVGFATAFDLLHGRLGPARRSLYLDAIVAAAGYMYERSFDRGWGQQYLHNHQPTNCVALLTAGLVVMAQGHLNDAYLWLSQAVLVMERALLLLREVRDGSLHEGVAYASYSTRSLLQYVHLLLRHLDVDHTGHPWLRQHFAFLYRTILPGFQRTVGIADSNYNWFYGPESQLAFLDAFVMRNGSGNWLADMIRKHRPASGPGAPSRSQRWTTLHTEFIWFDASLTPRPPPDFGSPRLHVFRDWGVATYGAAQPAGANASFFSFKSGKIGGRAIYDIVHGKRYAAWVRGWRNFNPGHEHPDQNSFVFVPSRGGAGGGGGDAPPAACVTEALYGPKYTFLNNGLMFSPPAAPDVCFPPWQGQVTESCDSKWMRYKRGAAGDAHGRLERAQERGGVVFARGEAAGAYDAALGLASVQRSALLLRPDLLLVVDHVRRRPGARASRMRAFFNNVDAGFRPVAVGALNGAVVAAAAAAAGGDGGDGGGVGTEACRMFWVDDTGVSARGKLTDSPFRSNHSFAGSYLASVVTPLRGAVTRAAFVFLGPSLSLRSLKLIPRNDSVTVYVIANSVLYTVYLRTDEATAPADGGAGGGVGRGGAVAMVSTDRNTVFFDGGAELPEERPAEDETADEDYEAAVDRTLERLRDTFRELDGRRNPRKPAPPGGSRPRGGSRRTAEKRGSGGNRERTPKRPRASRTRDDGDHGGEHGGDAAREPARGNNPRADFGDSDFIDTAEMHDRGLPRWELNPGEEGEEGEEGDAAPSTPGKGGARGRGDRLPELRPRPADAAAGGGFRNEPEAAGRSERGAAAVAPVPYARIFLLVNACGFAALLVAQLRCAGRHWVLHNHRVLYALLIADSVAIFAIYSTCSRTDC